MPYKPRFSVQVTSSEDGILSVRPTVFQVDVHSVPISSISHELLMIPHLLSSFDHTHPCPSLGTILRTTTAIHRCLPDDLPSFDPPEIVWHRSPTGVALVQPIRFGESERVLLTLDQPWKLLRDPGHAMAAVLAETELEYELLRPIEAWALQVQPQDVSLGLPPGEVCWLGSSSGRRYGAVDIDQIRTLLHFTNGGSAIPCEGTISFLTGKPLVPEAEARNREIVAAWDRHHAADILALVRSGLAVWRRIAVQAGSDSTSLEQQILSTPRVRNAIQASLRC
jgi:hypothetical protein